MKRTRIRSITTPRVTQEPCTTRQSVYDDELQSLEGCIARLTETECLVRRRKEDVTESLDGSRTTSSKLSASP